MQPANSDQLLTGLTSGRVADHARKEVFPMRVYRGSDGLPAPYPVLFPQPPAQQLDAFWDFAQKLSLLLGIVVAFRTLSG